MLMERRVVAVKIEAVEGTAETLTASDATFLVFKPKVELDINQLKRDPARATLSQMATVSGKRSGKISFSCELKGSGAAGTAPSISSLMKACGHSETIVASTSVTYKPASSSIPSATIGLYADGLIFKGWGARGNVKIGAKGGEIVMLDFEFSFADFSVTDGALLSPTYENVAPQPFLAAAFAIGGHSAIISSLTLDPANTIAMRESVSSSSGNLSAMITNRDPKITFDPEMATVAAHDFFGRWRSGVTGALSTVIGATAGNIVTISAPAVRYTKVSDSDRNGIAISSIDAALVLSSGDDEYSIALT